jgi:hypothetical protein
MSKAKGGGSARPTSGDPHLEDGSRQIFPTVTSKNSKPENFRDVSYLRRQTVGG